MSPPDELNPFIQRLLANPTGLGLVGLPSLAYGQMAVDKAVSALGTTTHPKKQKAGTPPGDPHLVRLRDQTKKELALTPPNWPHNASWTLLLPPNDPFLKHRQKDIDEYRKIRWYLREFVGCETRHPTEYGIKRWDSTLYETGWRRNDVAYNIINDCESTILWEQAKVREIVKQLSKQKQALENVRKVAKKSENISEMKTVLETMFELQGLVSTVGSFASALIKPELALAEAAGAYSPIESKFKEKLKKNILSNFARVGELGIEQQIQYELFRTGYDSLQALENDIINSVEKITDSSSIVERCKYEQKKALPLKQHVLYGTYSL